MESQPLRLIYATQSTGLGLFWRLHAALVAGSAMGECGFFLTNRYEYVQFSRQNPDFEAASHDVLTEWGFLRQADALALVDVDYIADWERQLGDGSLWNAIIIDRRLNYPLKAQFRQNYQSAYPHEVLLGILQVALKEINAQFDRVRPHAVLGLNAVTLYDYLYYLIARQRGIPYMQLKLTRVRNYVSWYTNPFELSPHIAEAHRRILTNNNLDDDDRIAMVEAREFIVAAESKTLVYEGAIRLPGRKADAGARYQRPPLRQRMQAWALRFRQQLSIRDRHYPTLLETMYQQKFLRPLRRKFEVFEFDVNDAAAFAAEHEGRYAIYPLNTEPEVALLAYGRPYRNQIETVRNLAASLPVGWKLVVKEHPNAFGYRKKGYYRKLKQIPNVLIASPRADTGRLTDGCGLVVLVYGTIGLEAIIKRKPVLILSRVPYDIFPQTMVRFSANPWQMGHDIRDLLDGYRYEPAHVEAYIAAHIRTGIRVNLFTGLLGKGGRQAGDNAETIDQQYVKLAIHVTERIAEERRRLAAAAMATPERPQPVSQS